MEAQLASTTAELRDLKARQSQLELLLQQAHISSDQNLHTAIPKVRVNCHKLTRSPPHVVMCNHASCLAHAQGIALFQMGF